MNLFHHSLPFTGGNSVVFVRVEDLVMERYEVVKDLGVGNFGVARLLRNKETKELVAMKYIERGHKVMFFFLI